MAYKTIAYREPAINTWMDLWVSGTGDTKLNFLQIDNMSSDIQVAVVLGLCNPSAEFLAAPSNLAAVVYGATGSTEYEYVVTSIDNRGESGPSISAAVVNGTPTLDETNKHSISWDEVPDATAYRIYCRTQNEELIWAREVDADTLSVENQGDWPLAVDWPWINITGIDGFLAYELLSPKTGLQLETVFKLQQDWAIKLFVTGPVSVIGCGEA